MTGRIHFTPEARQQLHQLDESSGEVVVNILGVFHGGQDWEAALSEDQGDPEMGL